MSENKFYSGKSSINNHHSELFQITLGSIMLSNLKLVKEFGGGGIGLKDENLADSLPNQVFQEVYGEKLYPTLEDKISYVVYSVIKNHVFKDGNKRTGILMLLSLCKRHNIEINCSDDELITLALDIASSRMSREDLRDCIRNYM